MAANKNMVNYGYTQQNPVVKVPPGETNGVPRVMHDIYKAGAAEVIAEGDVLIGQVLPKGAKIIKVELSTSAAMDTTGKLSVGLAPIGGTQVDDSLIIATDCSAAALRLNLSVGVAYPTLTADSNVVVVCSEAGLAVGLVIELLVKYVLV